MKNIILIILFFPFLFSAQSKKFFTQGNVVIGENIEKIPVQYVNHLPIVKVKIAGEFYNFIFDTGAPTVISNKIYDVLKLTSSKSKTVVDSQKNEAKQIFAVLPEMQVGNIVYKEVGFAVIDFKEPEFTCQKIEGIFGANAMEKLFWRINYKEGTIEATSKISNFDLSGYDKIIQFKTKDSQTPILNYTLFGNSVDLTFDTGFNQVLKLANVEKFIKNEVSAKDIFESMGTNSVGIYGGGSAQKVIIAKTPNLLIDKIDFGKTLVSSGSSNLIGNRFFENYSIILDWNAKKIYFEKTDNIPQSDTTFGFGYRFINNKATVVQVAQKPLSELHLGDEILSINRISLENLNEESACNYSLNRIESDQKTIVVKVKRGSSVLNLTIEKHSYFSE